MKGHGPMETDAVNMLGTGLAELRSRLAPAVRRCMATGARRLRPGTVVADEDHPERLAVLPFVQGRSLEIGCGYRKTSDLVLGVDLVPKGRPGRHGNVAGRRSQADVAADGAQLPFGDATFDSLVARHNLEHYIDTAGTLEEWRRVLRPGGMLAVVLPDEEAYQGRTVELDPTHYHAYSPSALARLVRLIGGFSEIETRTAVPDWSFLLTARRVVISAPVAG